jgi:DNA-binding transcriptional regulator GbsR (MarR family)
MNNHFAPRPEDHFIEQMGLITQAEGGPRISGRLFGLLIVEGRPLSLQEMAERLGVSKASVSTNARLLAQRGIIRLTTRPGARGDLYEFVPGAYAQILSAMGEKMRRTAETIDDAARRFPDGENGARDRIRELAEFHRVSADFIAEWSARLDRR